MRFEDIGWAVLGDVDSIRRVMLLSLVFLLLGPILLALLVQSRRVRDWIEHFIGMDYR